jgi:hypothetical protein
VGAGEEAVQEAGLVLHPAEPGLDQRGQLGDVVLGRAGRGSFQMRPDLLPAAMAASALAQDGSA